MTTTTEPEQRSFGEYRGKPITAITMAVKNAGDGLSKSLDIKPPNLDDLEVGETVRVLLEGEIKRHDYTLIEKADSYELKIEIKAGAGTLTTQGSADLRKVRDLIAKATETRQGKQRLAGMDADDLEGDES